MTKAQAPTFRPDTLAAQVVAFFQNNPDEELGLEDITEKFDVKRGNIHSLLGEALQQRALHRYRNDEGEYIYKAGNGIPTKPVQKAVNIDLVNRMRVQKEKVSAKPLPEIDAVQIDDNIPLTGRTGKKQDWTPLLKKLKVGQSFALPQQAYYMLSKNITDLHKASTGRFTTRTFKTEQQIRVWRTT